MALAHRYNPNPDYGRGIYRRRIQIVSEGEYIVHATLLDDYHEMTCVLRHNNNKVIGIVGDIRRAPFSTCAGAIAAFRELEGASLHTSPRAFYKDGRPQRNCTHIFDLAIFSIAYAAKGAGAVILDFIVPDLVETGSQIEAHIDGEVVHCWRLGVDEKILAPTQYAGRLLFGGFAKWAEGHFAGIALELALHLQKAVMVARGRRYLVGEENGTSIRDEPERIGACYSFSEPQFSIATSNVGYVRDYTSGLP